MDLEVDSIRSGHPTRQPTGGWAGWGEVLRVRPGDQEDQAQVDQAEPEVAGYLGERSENIRSFLYRNHRCYYVVTDEAMHVLRFLGMRRDPDAPLEDQFPG